ncbi:NADPH-dependent FMN reductase [Labedella phragmitis]|uniref:NADPH-dependent FMN reductase n=1 Tax=Labedella phragmitis TaxID=2498849 RepID=A0A3S4AEG2_9MICO|nr:FMN reductase [Labedella phragmitis]RWZ46507.1 NADPH-dependent FMN reductase [Labedella phragmitis]
MSDRRIVVVTAGLSTPSSSRLLADRIAAAVVSDLDARGMTADVSTVELREYGRDLMDNLITGFPSVRLDAMLAEVGSADGLIVVTPIFSTSYSGLFKTFIDVLDPKALAGTPVLIGANAGTARHSLAIDYAIRPLFAYLHAEAVPTGVFAASSDWGDADGDSVRPLQERVERAAGELATAIALKEPKPAPVDPFDPASFGDGSNVGNILGGLAGF